MGTITVVATVRKPENGYVLSREEKTVSSDMTIAEADKLFKFWGHLLLDAYPPATVEVRIQVWGQDMYWSY